MTPRLNRFMSNFITSHITITVEIFSVILIQMKNEIITPKRQQKIELITIRMEPKLNIGSELHRFTCHWIGIHCMFLVFFFFNSSRYILESVGF